MLPVVVDADGEVVCEPVGDGGAEMPKLDPSVAKLEAPELLDSEPAGGAAVVGAKPGDVAEVGAPGDVVALFEASVEAGTLLLIIEGEGVVEDSAVPGAEIVARVSVAEVVEVTVREAGPQL